MFCRVVIIFLLFIQYSFSYKILAVLPFPIKSHYRIYNPIMLELASRGHNVTVYTPYPRADTIPNYYEVDTSHCSNTEIYTYSVDELSNLIDNDFIVISLINDYIEEDRKMLNCGTYQQLLKSEEKYDLIITELFTSDTFLGFVNKFNIPHVALCPNVPLPWASDRIGDIYNPSYIHSFFNHKIKSLDKSTFLERLHNTYVHSIYQIAFKFIFQKTSEDIAREHFGQTMPSLAEISRKTNLILTYSNPITNTPRPHVPNVIEVGGVHIQKSKKLNQELTEFIENSPHGVVYFSMGSLLQGKTFSEEKTKAFINAFGKIPQRIIWKWEDETMPQKPDNVKIGKWLPQRDILAHPNVKLFISHGGSLGTNEAIYEGVPMLGIPIYGDQIFNLFVVQSNGAGEILEYNDISNETVLEKVQLMLNNPKYAENMKRMSVLFKDQPLSPMDKAMYWIEYVVRHNGANHLRCASADLPIYQYLLLDVISFIILCIIIIFVIVYWLLSWTLSKVTQCLGNVKYKQS